MPDISRLTELCHQILRAHVQPGDFVVDATTGNGFDSVFLADLVGNNGTLIGFDVNTLALQRTKERLLNAGLEKQATLYCCSHSQMGQYIHTPAKLVMFNLGYLPNSNKETRTMAETTIPALQTALHFLAVSGLLAVTAYRGHDEGKEEAAVADFMQKLPEKDYSIIKIDICNTRNPGPILYIIQKNLR